jgi:uncharacterized protein
LRAEEKIMTDKTKNHAINWFEIPATNIERASRFYGTILNNEVRRYEMEGLKMGILPSDEGAIHGALVQGTGYVPSESGALLYLNGGNDLSVILARVEPAGGQVLLPKTKIGEYGYMGWFKDPEGNRVALHSTS